jgi:hypothetical protein
MRLSFPSLPSVNQSFSFSGRNWKWSGSRWNIDSVTIKSTFQIAVENGFQGTEQDYADSINPTVVASNAAQAALASLTGSAPELLDTIEELAAALNNDENFGTTVSNQMTAMESEMQTMESEMQAMSDQVEEMETSMTSMASTGKAIAMSIVFG